LKVYDLLIVGAGTAGSIAAKTAAEEGLDVCLIDCKPEDKIGEKVCGDAVGKHHFDRLGLSYPAGEEFECDIHGIDVYSPDLKTVFRIEGKGVSGFGINRHKFGQRLLKEALSKDITFHDCTVALTPLIEEGFVKGAKAQNSKEGWKQDIRGRITIDASGISGIIRQNLPDEFGLERRIDSKDLMGCYREIRSNVESDSYFSEIYLTQQAAPGGYYWIFHKGEGKVNVGVGVQMREGYVKPKAQLYKYVLSRREFKDSKIIHGGGGIVPTRRPLDCLVANGIMLAGDAACLVNPIHGGGIGSSMLSGRLAAETAVDAIASGDLSRDGLWQYNIDYMKEYGGKQAGLDIFRIFLQSISDDEINHGMKHQLVKREDMLKASLTGSLKLSITDKAERAFKNLGRIGFLIRLRSTAKKMREIKKMYLEYPSPKNFEQWKTKLAKTYAG
jgi:geranylgeranyl reductase family protein